MLKAMIFWVDTFTDRQFRGNPTVVVVTGKFPAAAKMQSLAAEFNLPVTAFVGQRAAGEHSYDIRYYTPITEIPACGHATLASAAVLATRGVTSSSFHTAKSTVIAAKHEQDICWLQYPQYQLENYTPEPSLLLSMGLQEYANAGICEELEALFLELKDPSVLRTIKPNFASLRNSNQRIKEVVVTSLSDNSGYDFLLRSFCPWIGIDEDPVTGSVHSVLAGYWKSRLGKGELTAFQASARGGDVFVRSASASVFLGGKSVVVFSGEIGL